jgi:hypothetical protein
MLGVVARSVGISVIGVRMLFLEKRCIMFYVTVVSRIR